MDEKYFDSSIFEYEIEYQPTKYVKQLQWDMAIGLQEVDNLKPSKYLEKLVSDNVEGSKTIYEVEKELKKYYTDKDLNDKTTEEEFECDLVSTRIVQLLSMDNFELSKDYFKYIHEYLFKDIYEFNGKFREVNFSKPEIILNKDSVAYGDYKLIENSLNYDISLEQEKNYNEMNIVDVIKNITKFTSSIWQIHPFREGNTRTTAVFIEKYLISLGYNVDNALFKDKSIYFRNALVRSNYFNNNLNIKEDSSYLIKFYENLLLGKNSNLHSKDLLVKELFNKINLKNLTCKHQNINLDEYINFREEVKRHMEHPEWLGDFTKEELELMIKDNSKIWIYYNNQDFVCSMMIIPSTEKDLKKFEIDKKFRDVVDYGPMFVNPKYVGSGLQYEMLKYLDEYCLNLGYKYIAVTVHPDNIYSINNLLKNNFEKVNQKEFKRGIRNIYFKELK